MCGRFVQVWDAGLGRFVQVYVPTWKEEETILKDVQASRGYNIGPGRHIATLAAADDGVHLQVAHWGFRIQVPGTKGPVDRLVFNTRIEEAQAKPLWRGLLGKSHAVVPAQGFFEWTGPSADRVPHFVQREDGKPMLMAAVTGQRGLGAHGPCASIVTCAANGFMRTLHDRMPVILEEPHVMDWLQPRSLEGALELAQPSRAGLVSRVVSRRIGDVRNQGPDLLQADPSPQTKLF